MVAAEETQDRTGGGRNRWKLKSADIDAVVALRAELDCPEAVARLLVSRGITNETEARAFFTPGLCDLHEPGLMTGVARAVERILLAVERSEPILIYGDYDVDGTIATVLLKTAIERIPSPGGPAKVSFHIPHRLREGYGMQENILAAAAQAGVRLVISVDTGIRAFAAATAAKELGLDLIVTDHHLPDGVEGIPEAVAVINPAQVDCRYPNKHLCGAGVAFKLAHALLLSVCESDAQRQRLDRVLLPSFLKLVAIATIADSVPLVGENRAMVWLGLRALQNPVQPGLRALMKVAQLALDRVPTASEVGFQLGPRINAAGRMDIGSDVVELFLTRQQERATALAEKLDALNQDRRATEAVALDAIEIQLSTMRDEEGTYAAECIVLDDPEWHRGVLGILASRIVDRTGRPAIVLTTDENTAHGSGRSIDGYHLLNALTAANTEDGTAGVSGLFTRFGGHAHAVGFSLPRRHVPALRERLKRHSRSLLTATMMTPELFYDVELSFRDLTLEFFRWIERFAPFGMENREPVCVSRGLILAADPRIIKERHISLSLVRPYDGRPIKAMGWSRVGIFNWRKHCETLRLERGSIVDAAFHLRENRNPQYGGLELELLDLARSDQHTKEPTS